MHIFCCFFAFCFLLFLVWDKAKKPLKEMRFFKLYQKNSSTSLGPGTNFLTLCISLPLFNAKEEKTELIWASSLITVSI